jgi:hypothetical protein
MIMNWIVERLKEPSTWAGFAGLAAAVGISTPLYAGISAVGVAIAGLIAVLVSEKSAD